MRSDTLHRIMNLSACLRVHDGTQALSLSGLKCTMNLLTYMFCACFALIAQSCCQIILGLSHVLLAAVPPYSEHKRTLFSTWQYG